MKYVVIKTIYSVKRVTGKVTPFSVECYYSDLSYDKLLLEFFYIVTNKLGIDLQGSFNKALECQQDGGEFIPNDAHYESLLIDADKDYFWIHFEDPDSKIKEPTIIELEINLAREYDSNTFELKI